MFKKSRKTKKYRKHHKKGGDYLENKTMLQSNLDKTDRLQKLIDVACKTSKDNCVALGIYSQMIYHFFENFQNFNLVDTPNTKRIGKPSVNGFIWTVPFLKKGLTAYSVLKCSANETADNLYYEYYIGKYFINQIINLFPCFVETYDCYQLSKQKWQQLYDNNSNVPFNDGQISKYEGGWKESCTNNELFSVLIQHFDSSRFISLHDIREKFFDEYCKYFLPTYLYQVYFVLSCLGKNYTHYDLHDDNVFCYRPFGEKEYIMMNYHQNGKIVSFPSEFIVKIIDYGRNYFHTTKINTGQILKNKICNNPKCNPRCGGQFGYGVIQGDIENPDFDFYHMHPNKPNQSYDLRLMYMFKDYFKKLASNVKIIYKEVYGTPENINRGLKDGKVNNIYDAVNFLARVIQQYCKSNYIKRYDESWKQVGVINVYSDGKDYEYKQEKIYPDEL